MAVNSTKKTETRKNDKAGLLVMLAALALVVIAGVLLINRNSPEVVVSPPNAAIQSPAPAKITSDEPVTVGGRASDVGEGKTDSSSTTRTENGDGS